LVAEASAMRNGIRAALQANFTDIHIEETTKSLSKQFRDTSKYHGKPKF